MTPKGWACGWRGPVVPLSERRLTLGRGTGGGSTTAMKRGWARSRCRARAEESASLSL